MPVADRKSARASQNRPQPEQLRVIGLFGGLDDELLTHLAKTLPVLEVGAGEELYRQGERGHELYVTLEGKLEAVMQSRHGQDTRVAVFGPEDWFGELALIDVMPRPATVRAVTSARLLQMCPRHLDALYRRDVKAYALLIMNIARQLSRKLRVAEGILADRVISVADPLTTLPDEDG
jgi:CRP/FNR family cyclic AMP-dependent transcriptional regulator